MSPVTAEFVGTAILVLLGNGVVANCYLTASKGQGEGWIVIGWGWAAAVFVAVFIVAPFSGAHLNPAVTLGLAIVGKHDWAIVAPYIVAQVLGAMVGALLVVLAYRAQFRATEDKDLKLEVFATGPAIAEPASNIATEAIATFVLVFGVLFLASDNAGPGLGALDALPVALLVLGIGLGLGGPTGFSINPARDAGGRLAHMLLPIPGGKRDSDWAYGWVPLVGALIGSVAAALVFLAVRGGGTG